METYFCAVVVLSFLEENITPITIIAASLIALIGFFIGWLVGHLRNNQVLADMETALLKMENENRELKDYEAFYRHHLTAAFGSPSPLLTESAIKRQIMASKD